MVVPLALEQKRVIILGSEGDACFCIDSTCSSVQCRAKHDCYAKLCHYLHFGARQKAKIIANHTVLFSPLTTLFDRYPGELFFLSVEFRGLVIRGKNSRRSEGEPCMREKLHVSFYVSIETLKTFKKSVQLIRLNLFHHRGISGIVTVDFL